MGLIIIIEQCEEGKQPPRIIVFAEVHQDIETKRQIKKSGKNAVNNRYCKIIK